MMRSVHDGLYFWFVYIKTKMSAIARQQTRRPPASDPTYPGENRSFVRSDLALTSDLQHVPNDPHQAPPPQYLTCGPDSLPDHQTYSEAVNIHNGCCRRERGRPDYHPSSHQVAPQCHHYQLARQHDLAPQNPRVEENYANLYTLGQHQQQQQQRSIKRSIFNCKNLMVWILIVFFLDLVVVPGTVFLMLHVLKMTNSSLLLPGLESPSFDCISSRSEQMDLKQLFQKWSKEEIKAEMEKIQLPVGIVRPDQTNNFQQCASLFFLYEDSHHDVTENWKDFMRVRGWGTDGNVAYQTKRCMGYDDATGEITIYQPGVYLVYSHLAFAWKKPTDPRTTSKILGHQIRKISAAGGGGDPWDSLTLTKDTRAMQDVDPMVGHVPSYNSQAMTVFRLLERNATLAVEAKAIHLLMRGNSVTSFLIYRMA